MTEDRVVTAPITAEKNIVATVTVAVDEGAGVVTDKIEGIEIDTIPAAVEIEVVIEAEAENDADVEVEVQKDVQIKVVRRTEAIHQEEAEDEN